MQSDIELLKKVTRAPLNGTDASRPFPSFPTIIPLDDVSLPEFPIDALPAPFGDMVDAVAKATETPVELAAMIGLATVAACCQNVFEVSVDAGYREPLNLWTVVALESGNRKTKVHQKMTEPLRKKERQLCEQSKATIAQVESDRATTKERVKVLRARLANSVDKVERHLASLEHFPIIGVAMLPRLRSAEISRPSAWDQRDRRE
jgi:putative DNA primase/helicase